MNAPATVPAQGGALVASLATEGGAMTVAQLKANRELMKQAMAELMEKDKHYGVIKGTQKPTLYKPGAELLFVLFRVHGEPIIEDLSTDDCIRYRVKMRGEHMPTGQTVGWGVGECSTDEDKYKWRACVSQDEWEETPSDRRRWNFKSQVNQVRTNPADAANTILKMAEKRAKCDCALSFSAASDVFSQDLDDLAEWLREKETGEASDLPEHGKAGTKPPQRKPVAPGAPAQADPARKIDDKQLAVLKSHADAKGVGENAICAQFKVDRLEDLPFAQLNPALTWIRNANPEPPQ